MKLGLVTPTERRVSSSELRELAITAEQLGISSLWVGDHLVFPQEYESSYPYGSEIYVDEDRFFLESLTSLAFLAGVTTRIGIGTDVLITPLRRPLVLAKIVGSLSYLSDGRLQLGVGAGWLEEEFDLVGGEFSSRYSDLAEFIGLIRELAATSGSMTEADGSGYFAVPFGVSESEGPDVLYGGISEGACKRAVELADGWIGVGLSLTGLRQRLDWFEKYAHASDRSLSEFRIITSGLVDVASESTWDRDSRLLRGTPDQIVEHLEQYADLGVDEFILYPRAGREPGWVDRYIATFREVVDASQDRFEMLARSPD